MCRGQSVFSCHLWDMGIELRLSGLCIEPPRTITAPSLAVFFFFFYVWVWLYMWGPEKGVRFLGSGVVDCCELPDLGAWNKTWVLQVASSLDSWAFSLMILKRTCYLFSLLECWGLVQGFVHIELELCPRALDQLLRSALWFLYFNVRLW